MNVTSLAIIYTIVSIVTAIVNVIQGKEKRNCNNKICIDRNIYSKIFLICSIIFLFILIFVIFIIKQHDDFTSNDVMGLIIVSIFPLISFILSIIFKRYIIIIDNDSIFYRSYFGRKKMIIYNNISCVRIDDERNLYIYIDGKIVLKQSDYKESNSILLNTLVNKNVTFVTVDNNNFVVRPAKFYTIVFLSLAISILVMYIIILINVGILESTCYVGPFLIASILMTIYYHTYNITVFNNTIYVSTLFKKKNINISQIDDVVCDFENNANQITVYDKDNFKIKINEYFANFDLFKSYIKNQLRR